MLKWLVKKCKDSDTFSWALVAIGTMVSILILKL